MGPGRVSPLQRDGDPGTIFLLTAVAPLHLFFIRPVVSAGASKRSASTSLICHFQRSFDDACTCAPTERDVPAVSRPPAESFTFEFVVEAAVLQEAAGSFTPCGRRVFVSAPSSNGPGRIPWIHVADIPPALWDGLYHQEEPCELHQLCLL